MSNYKTVKFKVLSDNCSTEDHLEDRTHERISDKLYQIISAESLEGLTDRSFPSGPCPLADGPSLPA